MSYTNLYNCSENTFYYKKPYINPKDYAYLFLTFIKILINIDYIYNLVFEMFCKNETLKSLL
jgi:hypothetical protein